jgi:hypothetical protein
MKRFARFISATLGLAALLAAGCAGADDPGRTPGPASDSSAARQLLVRWHAALVGGDRTPYLACFAGTEDELVLAIAMQEAVRAAYAFHDAVLETYGPEGWASLQQSPGARVALWPREADWPMAITLVRTGTLAFAYLPAGRVPLHLFEDGGFWRIQAASLVPPGHTPERAAYFLFRWVAVLEELTARVRRPGATPAEVAPEASQELLRSKLQEGELPAAEEALRDTMLLQ